MLCSKLKQSIKMSLLYYGGQRKENTIGNKPSIPYAISSIFHQTQPKSQENSQHINDDHG